MPTENENRYQLTPTLPSDVDWVVQLEYHKDNIKFVEPNTYEEHHALLTDPDVEHLIISMEGRNIGYAILSGMNNKNHSVELRRLVIKEKGKGYGRSIVKLLMRYCFIEKRCHRLWLDVIQGNDRALHIYLTEGFVVEGTLRECVLTDGMYKSLTVMSIMQYEYIDLMEVE